MVKHLSIDLDDKLHEALTVYKDKLSFTWNELLQDWLKRVMGEIIIEEAEG